MPSTVIKTEISQLAEQHLEHAQFMDNPYFESLCSGTLDLVSFRRSQSEFYHAVKYFARPMSYLIARIPDPQTRLNILHNIVEEHGEFDGTQFHEATFRKFLQTIGCAQPAENPGPEVDAFNCLLCGVCSQEDLGTAICCIGMIEYAFAKASALIGKSVVERDWVTDQNLVHYKLHAEIDLRHAAEFFEIVEGFETTDLAIQRGLKLGLYAFDRLYRDLAVL
jgi:pyrroloquinoline-quinone synthase